MYPLWLVFVGQSLLSSLCIMMFYQWLDARWSGWRNLARLYRAEEAPPGKMFENATFFLNARAYRGIGTIAPNSSGLYVELMPAFRVLHPPLMVPWRYIKPINAGSSTEFELAAPFAVRLRLTGPVLRETIRQMELHSPDWRPAPRRLAG